MPLLNSLSDDSRFDGPFEVVQDGQQRAHRFGAGIFGELDAFFFGALAGVLELRLAAQETVLQLGFFGGQLIALGRQRGNGIGRIAGIGMSASAAAAIRGSSLIMLSVLIFFPLRTIPA